MRFHHAVFTFIGKLLLVPHSCFLFFLYLCTVFGEAAVR